MLTTIIAKTSFEGTHSFPNAPEEVKYLKETHRHIFNVCVELEVTEDEKTLDPIQLKHKIDGYISNWTSVNGRYLMGISDCIDIARLFIKFILERIPDSGAKYIRVTVMEDGQTGGTVTWGGAYDGSKNSDRDFSINVFHNVGKMLMDLGDEDKTNHF